MGKQPSFCEWLEKKISTWIVCNSAVVRVGFAQILLGACVASCWHWLSSEPSYLVKLLIIAVITTPPVWLGWWIARDLWNAYKRDTKQ